MYIYSDEPPCKEECFDCMHKENKIDDIKYWLTNLLEQLYSDEKLDIQDAENCLEELCGVVGIKIPKRDIAIERKHFLKVPEVVQSWIQWNNQYIKNQSQGI
jgi:molybdopterin/thiamine biosynthesis adenylyltransferase